MLIRAAAGASESEPLTRRVEASDLAAFAAAAGETRPDLVDAGAQHLVAHPLFPVCLEWPVLLHGLPGLEFPEGGAERGLHAGHDLARVAPIRAGARVATTAGLAAAVQTRTGVHVTIELRTSEAGGDLLAITRQGVFFPGARLEGGDPEPAPAREASPVAAGPVTRFAVGLRDAVLYSAGSGIHNPIHTDSRVARAAGLPGPILHGTATLARCVSAVVDVHAGGDHRRVRRLGGRFSGMVPLPAEVEVYAEERASKIVFEARLPGGEAVLSGGFVELGS